MQMQHSFNTCSQSYSHATFAGGQAQGSHPLVSALIVTSLAMAAAFLVVSFR